MSNTTELRKLADEYAVYSCERGFLSGALVAACDRLDAAEARCRELEAENKRLHDFHYERTKLTDMHIKRAGAAEAELADLKEMAATDQRCAEALADAGFLRTESLWDQTVSALNFLYDTKAELARVTVEAAGLREALEHYAQPNGLGEESKARETLSSTSAGAGLLKRLEAAEAVLNLMENEDAADINQALEAWRRAKGET